MKKLFLQILIKEILNQEFFILRKIKKILKIKNKKEGRLFFIIHTFKKSVNSLLNDGIKIRNINI